MKLTRRVIQIAKPYWLHLLGIFILNLISMPLALLNPIPIKLVLDYAFGSEPIPAWLDLMLPESWESWEGVSMFAALLIIGTAVLRYSQGMGSWLLQSWTGEKLVLDLRTLMFNQVQRLSLQYHDQKGSSESLYRIQYDAYSLRGLLINNLFPFITASLTLLGMLYVMTSMQWQFTLVALTLVPLLFFLTRYSSTRLRTYWDKVKKSESSAMAVVHETLGALRVVKAFGREDQEAQRFKDRSWAAIRSQMKVAWMGGIYDLLLGMLMALATASVLYMGALFVNQGSISLGDLTVIMAYLAQMFGPMETISKNINSLQSSLASSQRVFDLLDMEREVKESENPVSLKRAKGNILFEKMAFGYKEDTPVLQDINIQIQAGQKVGILGTTGAGKSTLLSLLTRLYEPQSGKIALDGMDIREYALEDYRRQFAIVLQEPVLFSTSIAENIAYGNPDASREEIIAAAKAARAHDFIMQDKEAYDAQVGERGMQLSGGERQRISLARAFIRNAPILILDEPTSSVDIGTEAAIMEVVENLMKGRTTFLITHRLDTLKDCDVLLHLKDGQLHRLNTELEGNVLEAKKALTNKENS
ncbi:MAG: ABC transporter ATP-binding protein [Bacteroidia bacterium]|nr:ABC transporter ATP-binding protein [Bacteroidia bacterium]